jgi:hypothetical protein
LVELAPPHHRRTPKLLEEEEDEDVKEREVAPHHFPDAVVIAIHELHATVTSQIRHHRSELELQNDEEGLCFASALQHLLRRGAIAAPRLPDLRAQHHLPILTVANLCRI